MVSPLIQALYSYKSSNELYWFIISSFISLFIKWSISSMVRNFYPLSSNSKIPTSGNFILLQSALFSLFMASRTFWYTKHYLCSTTTLLFSINAWIFFSQISLNHPRWIDDQVNVYFFLIIANGVISAMTNITVEYGTFSSYTSSGLMFSINFIFE